MVYAVQFNFPLESKIFLTPQFKFNKLTLYPIINRISDHDAQHIIICNMCEKKCNTYYYFNCKIDKFSIMDFITRLSYESWANIFNENNVNNTFNNFLNMYLTTFDSSFPHKIVNYKSCDKAWLTPGTKI
jgi:hypothetical protein